MKYSLQKLKMISWFESKSIFVQILCLALFCTIFLLLVALIVPLAYVKVDGSCFSDILNRTGSCYLNALQKYDEFFGIYKSDLRGNFFSGYISLGAFLLSLKTFIVVSIKKGVYETPAYVARVEKRHGLTPGSADEKLINMPLKQLSDFLFYAIVFSLITAVAQVTIGLSDNIFLLALCIWFALFSLSLVFNCLRLIKSNIDAWLGFK